MDRKKGKTKKYYIKIQYINETLSTTKRKFLKIIENTQTKIVRSSSYRLTNLTYIS